jgi:hypothetical protein
MAEATIAITLKINHAFEGLVPKPMIDREMQVTVKKGACVDDLIREVVGLPHEVVPLIFVNGIHAKLSDVLISKDRVTLWMPMAGG